MAAVARDELFDLAVNRALRYARRTRALDRTDGVTALARELELWQLRTRFASRLDLEAIARCLRSAPPGEVHWRGGPDGGWCDGRPPRP